MASNYGIVLYNNYYVQAASGQLPSPSPEIHKPEFRNTFGNPSSTNQCYANQSVASNYGIVLVNNYVQVAPGEWTLLSFEIHISEFQNVNVNSVGNPSSRNQCYGNQSVASNYGIVSYNNYYIYS